LLTGLAWLPWPGWLTWLAVLVGWLAGLTGIVGQAGWTGWLAYLACLMLMADWLVCLAWLANLVVLAVWPCWLACLACLAGWTVLPVLAGLYRNSYFAAHMARVQLRERHQAKLRHKLEMLKAHQGWQQLDMNKQVKCRRLLLRLGWAGLVWAGLC
jgi:hypothetical protein